MEEILKLIACFIGGFAAYVFIDSFGFIPAVMVGLMIWSLYSFYGKRG